MGLSGRSHPVRGAAIPLGLLGAVHAGPLLTGIPQLRGLWPRVAGRGRDGHVALSFDDGPDDRGTPEVLDVLAAHGTRATFFVLGAMVERHPGVLDRVVAEGHEVAVHSWDHRNHLRHTPAGVHRQLARTVAVIGRRTGREPRWFRPPYGALTSGAGVAARRLGLRPVLWTAWGRDWEDAATGPGVAALVSRQLQDGGTLLLHDSDCTSAPDSWRATVGALPAVLARCAALGLEVGPVGEHGLR